MSDQYISATIDGELFGRLMHFAARHNLSREAAVREALRRSLTPRPKAQADPEAPTPTQPLYNGKPAERLLEELQSIRGIGPKTALDIMKVFGVSHG